MPRGTGAPRRRGGRARRRGRRRGRAGRPADLRGRRRLRRPRRGSPAGRTARLSRGPDRTAPRGRAASGRARRRRRGGGRSTGRSGRCALRGLGAAPLRALVGAPLLLLVGSEVAAVPELARSAPPDGEPARLQAPPPPSACRVSWPRGQPHRHRTLGFRAGHSGTRHGAGDHRSRHRPKKKKSAVRGDGDVGRPGSCSSSTAARRDGLALPLHTGGRAGHRPAQRFPGRLCRGAGDLRHAGDRRPSCSAMCVPS